MTQAGDRSYRWLRSAVAGFLFVFTAAAVQGQLELASRVHPSQISETGAHAWRVIDFSPLSRLSMSADGRYIVFVSAATNLVPGQKVSPSGVPGFNVFLRDLVTGSTTLVSRSMSSPMTTGNQDSPEAVLSADGRYVVFTSSATDLAPGQDQERDPFGQDLLLYDRITGAVTLVVQPSPAHLARNFEELRISPNGRWIAFVSAASDLVPGQFYVGGPNVFLHDRVEKKTRLVSHSEESTTKTRRFRSWSPLLSDDGRYVAFLGHDDSNALPGRPYAFLYDRRSEALTQIGIADGVAMSADGRFVARRDWSTTYLYDRDTRQTTLLGTGSFTTPAVSGDGRYIAFGSSDDNLVPGQQGDTQGGLFLYDRIARTFSLASREEDSATRSGSNTDSPAISRDGRYVVFVSADPDMVSGQTDIAETNEGPTLDVFLFDRTSGKTTLLSGAEGSPSITGNGHSWAPTVSANGARVAFWSSASDLVEGLTDRNEGNDVFIHETASGETTVASVRAPELPSLSAARASAARSLSADGRYVAFVSESPYLVSGQVDTNNATDVFLYDRTARATTLVSRAFASAKTAGNGRSTVPILSADGRYVAFASEATNLVPGNETGPALFLYDRASATTKRLSALGFLLEDYSLRARQFSADGRYLVFVSREHDLVPGQQEPASVYTDVFLYDLVAGTTTLVSRSIAGATVTADKESSDPAVSADGRFVAFLSEARDLIPGHVGHIDYDNNVFLYDRTTGAMTLVSRAASSATTGVGAFDYSMSADGRFIAFSSFSDPAVGLGSPSALFLYDRTLGTNKRIVSGARQLEISANGRFTLLISQGLLPELDPGTSPQLYVYDAVAQSFTLVTRKSAPPGSASAGQVRTATISADGRSIAFVSDATDLVAGQVADPLSNPDGLYLFDRVAGTTSLISGSGTPPKGCWGSRAIRSSPPTDGISRSPTRRTLSPRI